MPSELLPGGEPSGLLSGLVQGYTRAQAAHAQADLQSRTAQRDDMLKYLGMMVNNQEVAPEHRQWALQKIQEGLQHDISKKPWEVKFSELPPVTQKTPGAIQSQTLPGNTPPGAIQAPQPPPGMSSPTAAPSAAPSASGGVGRAANGTVNALGQAPQAPMGPTLPPPPPGQPLARQPIQMPTPPQGLLSQAPDTTREIAPGGAAHLRTPEEKLSEANALEQSQMNMLRQQYPEKSPEDLAYFAHHGEFPKDEFTLTPGEARFKNGKEIARNTEPKPGSKSGYEPMMGPGGPIGVKDVATGGMLAPSEVANNPKAKAVLDQAVSEHKAQLTETEARDNRKAAVQAAQQARAFSQQARMLEARGEALTANTKSMVEAVPKVQELSQRIRASIDQQEQTLGPMASRWQEFMSGKIGSPNSDFTKLRTDTGLLQTLLMRMHVGARGGQGMISHFKDLIDNSKQSPENMRAALDEIDAYSADVAKQGVDAKEATAAKAEGRAVKTPQPPTTGGGTELPPQARAQLQEGHNTTFANGQVWTLKNGQPEQVKAQGAK